MCIQLGLYWIYFNLDYIGYISIGTILDIFQLELYWIYLNWDCIGYF